MIITKDEIIRQLTELNKAYQSGELKVTHKKYLRMYSKINNLNSVSNQVKRFGAKVTRDKGYIDYYIYQGKNFTCGFNEATCETTWWEVSLIGDNLDQRVYDNFYDYNSFQTKAEVLSVILQFDISLSE